MNREFEITWVRAGSVAAKIVARLESQRAEQQRGDDADQREEGDPGEHLPRSPANDFAEEGDQNAYGKQGAANSVGERS